MQHIKRHLIAHARRPNAEDIVRHAGELLRVRDRAHSQR